MSKPPVKTFQNGLIKVKIWAHLGEKGTFYSVQPLRAYKVAEKQWSEVSSFSNADIIKVQRLLGKAYDYIEQLKKRDSKPMTSSEIAKVNANLATASLAETEKQQWAGYRVMRVSQFI